MLTSSVPLMGNVCEFSTFKGIMAESINRAVSSTCDIYLLSPFWLYVSKGTVFYIECLFIETTAELMFGGEVKFIIIGLHMCLFHNQ